MEIFLSIGGRRLPLRADAADVAVLLSELSESESESKSAEGPIPKVPSADSDTQTQSSEGPGLTFPEAFERDGYLATIAGRPVDPLPAMDMDATVFDPVRSIGDPQAVAEWFCRQLSAPKPLLPNCEAHQILTVAASIAITSLRPPKKAAHRYWGKCIGRGRVPLKSLQFIQDAEFACQTFQKRRRLLDKDTGPLARQLRRDA